MDKFRRNLLSIILLLAVSFAMVPWTCLTMESFAEDEGDYFQDEDAVDFDDPEAGLEEIARQFADENADAYAFRRKPGVIRYIPMSSYPDSFDLRDVDGDGDADRVPMDDCYVTPVKNQSPWGTCWGFAAIKAAETSILGDKSLNKGLTPYGLDLSEKHLAWFTYEPVNEPGNPQNGEGLILKNGNIKDHLDHGGFPAFVTSVFATGTGPVLESADESFEYHGKKKRVFCSGDKTYDEDKVPAGVTKFYYSKDDDWTLNYNARYIQSYSLRESYVLPTPSKKTGSEKTDVMNAIKEQIINKRAVQVDINIDGSYPEIGDRIYPTRFMSPQWAHYNYDKDAPVTHAVTIIGWDNNYPRENFTHLIKDSTLSEEEQRELTTPDNDGAWLVINSWGSETEQFPDRGYGYWGIKNTDGQHTGCFWLSYEEKKMENPEALCFDDGSADKGYKTYQHSYMPISEIKAAYLPSEFKMANVFTAAEKLRVAQLSCETTAPFSEVRYEVYALRNDSVDPTDGTKVAELDRIYKYGGFHKEKLTGTLPELNKGEKFSVIVTQKSPDNNYIVIRRTAYNKEYADKWGLDSYFKSVINEGESLVYAYKKWRDLSDVSTQNWICRESWCDMDNFPIRAYTVAVKDPEPAPVEEEPAVRVGMKIAVDSGFVRVTSVSDAAVSYAKAGSGIKSVSIPASVDILGKRYKVTGIDAKAFKGRSVTTLTVRSKYLTKKSVKGSLKGSKVKTVKVKVGSKKQNRKYVKKYKKIFTKKNAGKKVRVK